jgi:UDP-galactopyranose mutase
VQAGYVLSCSIATAFERVEEFKYLGSTLTNQNSILEEIKSRSRLGNACYYSVHNLFVFQVAIQKFKDQDIMNYNFAYCFCLGVKLGR